MIIRNYILSYLVHTRISTKIDDMSLFPFLSLPPELRLMVYEFLPIQTKHYHYGGVTGVDSDTWYTRENSSVVKFTFMIRSAPVAILATCRIIHDEPKLIIQKKVNICEEPTMKLMVSLYDLEHFRFAAATFDPLV
jgi:hypothetical protein